MAQRPCRRKLFLNLNGVGALLTSEAKGIQREEEKATEKAIFGPLPTISRGVDAFRTVPSWHTVNGEIPPGEDFPDDGEELSH